MVTDFKHLNFFKNLLDDNFDHKFIMDINDPLLSNLFPEIFIQEEPLRLIDKKYFKIPDLEFIERDFNFTNEIKEKLEGLVLVDFVPTSENLSKYFFNIIEDYFKDLNQSNNVQVAYVDFYETAKSHCRYSKWFRNIRIIKNGIKK